MGLFLFLLSRGKGEKRDRLAVMKMFSLLFFDCEQEQKGCNLTAGSAMKTLDVIMAFAI